MPRKMPTVQELFNPLLSALRALGGSGSITEIDDKVIALENYPDELASVLHDPENSTRTQIGYRLAWARTYLKKYGLLENSGRAVWALTAEAKTVERVDPREVVKTVRSLQNSKCDEILDEIEKEPETREVDNEVEAGWKQQLHALLTRELSPSAFERLTQRLLREAGFVQVEVTGRAGDGGIDGKGIAKVHGLLSFHVLFQCKRYQGAIGPAEIRDFRGAMTGRSDKGLFITTGTFTAAATKEASRDGAPPIDLVDGDALAEKLKELGLGLKTEMIEVVRIQKEWFVNI